MPLNMCKQVILSQFAEPTKSPQKMELNPTCAVRHLHVANRLLFTNSGFFAVLLSVFLVVA